MGIIKGEVQHEHRCKKHRIIVKLNLKWFILCVR